MSELLRDDRSSAVISDCEDYRYRLTRTWDVAKPTIAFVMLNPSTADGTDDDPTIRRCLGFAKDWDYGRLVVANLYALRSPDPSTLDDHPDPIGPANDAHLRDVCERAETIVGAWGANASVERAIEVADLLDDELSAIDTTKAGHPAHPLYQPADAELEEWRADALRSGGDSE